VARQTRPQRQQAEADAAKASAKSSQAAPRRTRQNSSAPAAEPAAETPAAVQHEPSLAKPIAEISESEDELHQTARKGKSALRLKPSRASKAASKGGKGKAPAGISSNEDEEDEEDEPRSSPAGGKRKFGENPEHDPRRGKRRHSKALSDEGIDMPESPSTDSPGAIAGAPLSPPADIAETARPDPVQEDTWICALDGCTHKVYLASQLESQRLIREHYTLHAFDDDERVQLVKRLKAPSLPVSHLMERVRLQAKVDGFPGNRVAGTSYPPVEQGLPEPIVQRY